MCSRPEFVTNVAEKTGLPANEAAIRVSRVLESQHTHYSQPVERSISCTMDLGSNVPEGSTTNLQGTL